jgi:hypothetical protein
VVAQLANILIRQANKTDNPRAYLDNLIAGKVTLTSGGTSGAILSTTVNGKSVTYQSVPGVTVSDYMAAAELALSYLEAGFTRVHRQTLSVFR